MAACLVRGTQAMLGEMAQRGFEHQVLAAESAGQIRLVAGIVVGGAAQRLLGQCASDRRMRDRTGGGEMERHRARLLDTYPSSKRLFLKQSSEGRFPTCERFA